MNKTWKRQVFRHTALYTAILMFSHTGGGGQAQAQTHKYAIVMNAQNLPEVKWGDQYQSLTHKSNEREVIHTSGFGLAKKSISFSFNNTDEVVAEKKDTVVFGAATYLPPYGKVSGFDTAKLTERKNALDQIGTTKTGLVGYSYEGSTCSSGGCPTVAYRTQFTFGNSSLAKKTNGGGLDIYEDKSRDNSPIYKLKDHPWLGVSFNLGGESSFKPKRQGSLVSSFSEDVTQQNGAGSQHKDKNLVYTTDDYKSQNNKNHQDKHHAVAFYLNAKLHLLDKKHIKNIVQGKTVNLGILKTRIEPTEAWKRRNSNFFNGSWTYEEKGTVSVKLKLPEVKAGRCINANNPNKSTKAPSPALTAPALWFGPVQNGKVQMYSASVSTYPDSSSSRIFLQNLKRKNDPNKPGRYSLADLSENEIKSKEPSFTSRQTVIRLDKGVHQIKLQGNEVANFNGNDGKNDTFGIVSEGSFMPDASEWKKVLLPWTVRASNDDGQFNTFNKEEKDGKPKYSQKYRSRDNGKHERNLGDIVNSPIVAVGEYLATSANDGMVHIFKQSGGDKRSYNLKLSYIPGTMPRKDIQNTESTLAKELRAFAEKSYVGDRYGVDGGFVLRKVERNGKDHVFMFGAMGFGGRGAYALDLSKIDSGNGNLADVSLFDVKHDKNGNNGVKLGYTVGTPQIGKTHDGKYAAFLASGYATKDITSGDNKTALYVYDLESSGTLIKKIEVPGGKGGLSSPTLVDKDLDGTVDIAYAGDRGGSMYRFDLSNQDPNQWSVRAIFEGTKPITSAPAISQLKDKRVVIFGTGSDLSEDDVLSTSEQYIYGIFDDDTATTGNVKVDLKGLGGGLLEQVLSRDNDNKTLFLTDYKRSDGSGSKGWVVKLKGGQRVTVKPTVVLRTAFVTIHKYTGTDKCGAETAILGINTADGGKLTKKSARPIVPAENQAVAQYSGHKKGINGKSIPIGCMQKGNEIVCPNGYVYDKPVNVRYLDEKKTDGFSTTADGDAGGSGIDPAGKRSGKNNRCFSQKGVRTLLMNDLDSLDITGPTCGMKRISWREVFY
ncbi:PilC family type IV pilus tip adhesin [Neisseria meningitidis]|uniref:PilC family type IV pilus tip adhesin n=3 Tax=Neisseria meningitidis TaxID=487 RepID=UPI000766D49C|nr:PilC family type IV pilus tip adhesin [Neisseria meningitidis]CWM52486.1 type IV pilus assembly protein PilC [Neisseria meningitidis]CWN54763.1 type IV pilus assembly protein PilC [Neisseria meningitidis]CWR55389.1 type IV pilus assembly protein PilC [Neisseria meningitidis]